MTRGYFGIALVGGKNLHNYGGALRAAYCYGASFMVLDAPRFKYDCENVPCAERHIPLHVGPTLQYQPFNCPLVVMEKSENARSLPSFQHLERAMYVFGPEDGSVPKHIMERAQAIVQVPMRSCMNLAASVNVVLYDRMAKAERSARGISYKELAVA